jgi:hypothetical protein
MQMIRKSDAMGTEKGIATQALIIHQMLRIKIA